MTTPLFLVFEGIDGAGTTTQAQRLYDRLRVDGHPAVLTREPGGTPLAERIRSLVLDPTAGPVDDRTELLLYGAARRQHVTELIAPSLEAGKPVISDRYAASTVAYQGGGRGLGVELTTLVNEIATASTVPDLTLYLDLPVDLAADRRRRRGGPIDRLEQAGDQFQVAVREAYLALAASQPTTWLTFDGARSAEDLHEEIWSRLTQRFTSFPFHQDSSECH